MCECCKMKKMADGIYSGAKLPKDNIHIGGNKAVSLQIQYDVYIEHFYLCIIIKELFKSNIKIHPLNNCPNCGADLFKVWDGGR